MITSYMFRIVMYTVCVHILYVYHVIQIFDEAGLTNGSIIDYMIYKLNFDKLILSFIGNALKEKS